ncbi:hypothetical protein SCHPADRAFT_994041, partial [Schizopora paradoxa]
MTIAAQNSLNLEDIEFDQPGGPVQFDNPSDTIFASLFLPVSLNEDGLDSVPWQFCDRILYAIRSPQFDPKKVTFKNCGDMFCSIGSRRRDMWSAVEARPTCNASFPMVILDGIVDCLQAEMPPRTSSENRDYTYDQMPEVRQWTKTLQSMMLVHSSWHARAKRCLGHSLVSSYGPIPTTLQNPTFGLWTKELHLSFNPNEDDEFDQWSVALTQYHNYLMKALCSRLPNIRLASICLEKVSANVLAPICDALAHLDSLKELRLKPAFECDEFPVHLLITAISEARHPTLQVLQLYEPDFNISNLPSQIDSLAPLEKLHSVQLEGRPLEHFRAIGFSKALWSRDPAKRGSHFRMDNVTIDCVPESSLNVMRDPFFQGMNESTVGLLRSTELVKFRFVPRQPQITDRKTSSRTAERSSISSVLGSWLALCSSARTVVFHDFAWTQTKMFEQIHEQFGALEEIKELVIEAASHSPSGLSEGGGFEAEEFAKTQFPLNDDELSRVVGTSLFPGLRVLKVTFSKRWLEMCVEDFKSDDVGEHGRWRAEERRMLLPQCRKRCAEGSIRFDVDIL